MALADGEGDVLGSDALDVDKLLSSQGSPGTALTGVAMLLRPLELLKIFGVYAWAMMQEEVRF
jgi:hypothetical protein